MCLLWGSKLEVTALSAVPRTEPLNKELREAYSQKLIGTGDAESNSPQVPVTTWAGMEVNPFPVEPWDDGTSTNTFTSALWDTQVTGTQLSYAQIPDP